MHFSIGRISKNNTFKDLLKSINLAEAQSIDVAFKQSYDTDQSELGSLKAVVTGSQRAIQKLGKLEDVCPTCEQSIDSYFKQRLLDEEHERVRSASRKIKNLENRIEEIKESNKQFEYKERTERCREGYNITEATNTNNRMGGHHALRSRRHSFVTALIALKVFDGTMRR